MLLPLLCRLEQSHLGELLDFAPKDELQNILALVCNMFSVKYALVSLFFDRRVYIIDGTGVFTVSMWAIYVVCCYNQLGDLLMVCGG